MAKNLKSLNTKLFDLLRSKGYHPKMLDVSGREIPVPEEAEVFQFTFEKDGKEYGTVTISIDGLQKLIVYYGDDVADSEKEQSHGSDDVSWYKLLNHLKRFAQSHQLSFEIKNLDNLKYDMAKRDHMKKQEKRISEGYYPMGKKASYSDSIPTVKMIIQHTRQIEEGEQRYRNIARIFVENVNGERFLIPTLKPGLARVYARHIAEGGTPYDERGKHITSLVEEYTKMAGFVRATRNGQFNESAQKLVNEGLNHYANLRETLQRMTGHRGYNAYFESYTPTLMEDDTEVDNINELFVQETLDPRIESVMPILSKLHKKISEMNEIGELSDWAKSITESDTGDTPISKMSDKELAEYLDCSEETVKKDREAAEEKAKDKQKDLVDEATDLKSIPEDDIVESDVSESGLQAYLGNKKYGKKGMDALRKAGREGASKEKMAQIRAKYDKLDEVSDDAEQAHLKMQTPAVQRKAKGGDWKVSTKDIEKAKERTGTSPEGLAAIQKRLKDQGLMETDLDEGVLEKLKQLLGKMSGKNREEDVTEDLSPEQKRVGQLGPTEKVKNANIGKLVGANESVELSEAEKKKKDFFSKLQKKVDASNKAKEETKEKVKQHKDDQKKEVKEGQEDLDAILRIIKK